MKIRNQIEYRAVAGLLALCRILPESWVYALYKALGFLAFLLLVRRRKTAYMNTGVVFPDKSPRERRRLVRSHFLNLAESLAHNALITCGRVSNDEILEMVEADDWGRLMRLMETAPKGVLIISAHIGNWELLSQYLGLRIGKSMHVIARESDNPLLEKQILLPLRERFGIRIFYKKKALMKIVQATRKGNPAGIMVDQKLNLRQGIPNSFFGRIAGTTTTPAILQLRFGIAILPIFMVKTGRRKYRMIIRETVPWDDNGKPQEEQIAELTAIHQKIIEEVILEYPDQWFWVHDRWGLNKGGK